MTGRNASLHHPINQIPQCHDPRPFSAIYRLVIQSSQFPLRCYFYIAFSVLQIGSSQGVSYEYYVLLTVHRDISLQ
jgi:hypothetical protein